MTANKDKAKIVDLPKVEAAEDKVLRAILELDGTLGLADCGSEPQDGSKVARKLNKSRQYPCPTGGRQHPACSSFTYWTGPDVLAFVAKHSKS